jgi:hypothetical protein
VPDLAAIEFFVVATVRFRLLYCFSVLRHDAVRWTVQQVVKTFPFDNAPRFLIREHDGIHGQNFREQGKVAEWAAGRSGRAGSLDRSTVKPGGFLFP